MKQRFNKLTGNAPPVKCLRPRVRSASTDAASSSKVQMSKPRRLRRDFLSDRSGAPRQAITGVRFRSRVWVERRGQFDLDVDLARVDLWWALEQSRHDDRERYHEGNHDKLQPDPGNGAPVNVRALDFSWSHAAQVEQSEAEWWVHERGLHVHAQDYAEPDQGGISTNDRSQHLLCDRRNHRNDDEGNFKEVEEESQEENKKIDEHEKAPCAARQGRKHILQPVRAIDAHEHDRETGRADQDKGDHRSDPHGRFIALLDQP